jgi:hypothetical protein
MLTPDDRMLHGYSLRELHACAAREAKLRRRVYANRVETRRMSQAQADREIALMDIIAEHFAALAERERLI